MTLRQLSLSLFACILFSSLSAQNFSGNVANFSNENLSYSNIEIYKGKNLVANAIADHNGNFSLQLDSGLYRIEVLNSGYKKEVFDLKIDGNVSKDFKLNDDPNGKKRMLKYKSDDSEEVEMLDEVVIVSEKVRVDNLNVQSVQMAPRLDVYESVKISKGKREKKKKNTDSRSELILESESYVPEDTYRTEGSFGESLSRSAMHDKEASTEHSRSEVFIGNTNKRKSQGKKFKKGLTAGEINDFSKWDLWEDITENKLYVHQRMWQIVPKHRYMVQLIDENASPIVNAKVELAGQNKEILWKARTDNTGKAELWGRIDFYNLEEYKKPSHISIDYHGQKEKISNPLSIKEGVNSLMFQGDCEVSNDVEIAFVVDATGSMGDEIEFLKEEIAEIMYQAKGDNKKLLMKFANVFYRDNGDEYITKHSDFTKVLSETGAFIDEQGAAGGGDGPEAVEQALDLAINTLSWTDDARSKILFLVLDAPPHNRKDIREKIKTLNRTAAEKGIRIVPITGSGLNKSTEYLMRAMALCTNGTYTFLTDHSGIGEGHIEPTTDSYDVQLMTDLMVDIIKNYTYVPECEEETPTLAVDLPDSEIAYQIERDSLATDHLKQDIITNHILNTFIGGNDHIISWKYWPNPTMGDLNIEVSESVERLYLSDMNGKLIREIEMNGAQKTYINLEGLATGVYLLRYPIGKRWISGKVVLTR